MEYSYRKEQFHAPGFYLRHTAGPDAAGSTTNHLHLNTNRMLIYFIQGSGNLVVEDQAHKIQAGDVIITDATELFHCLIDPNTYHERLSLHIEPQYWETFPCDTDSLFRVFTARQKGRGNLLPANVVESSGLGVALYELFTTVRQTSPNRDILALSKLIQTLDLLNSIRGTADSHLPQKDHTLHMVLQYLNSHCAEDISVESVAAHFHITPSYLAHWFKKHTGLSPWNYVILRRLQLANAFMTQGASAEEACYLVGFDNYANFFRLYKKHTGIAPSQFKKQMQKQMR